MPVDPTLQAKGEYKATGSFQTESFPGYTHWPGIACASTFFAILVFLLITGPLQPIPWWRSAAVMAGGVGILGGVLFAMRYPPGKSPSQMPRGSLLLDPRLSVATYIVFGLGVGLVLLAAIEMRLSIARRDDRQSRVGEPLDRPNSTETAEA